jgi:putative ABC transport system ATP-binding protein
MQASRDSTGIDDMVKIENLAFQYRDKHRTSPTIRIHSLEIRRQRKTVLSGKSGCGKTTLLNLMTGILRPQSGSIRIDDQNIPALSDRARRLYRLNNIGYVLQEFSLIPHLKLQDNIKLPFYINPDFSWKSHHQDMMDDLVQRLRIHALLKKYPNQLSVGEKQRACLCRALVTRPALILADEPTANLDEENRDEVLRILDDYLETEQATLIMVCHDMTIHQWFDAHISFKDINHV